jgi:phage-related protein
LAEKPLVVMGGVIKSPPFSTDGRREAGYLLRMLQLGESIGMPHSRPLPAIGPGCHELRVVDQATAWRIVYCVDEHAVVVLEVFAKKSQRLPLSILRTCQRRLAAYRAILGEEEGS